MKRLFDTPQAYYDELVRRSAADLFPASDENGCSYRQGDRACGVGVLIPNDVYRTEMDKGNQTGVSTVFQKFGLGYLIPEGMTLRDLEHIQSCHDNMSNETEWNHEEFVRQLSYVRGFKDVIPAD